MSAGHQHSNHPPPPTPTMQHNKKRSLQAPDSSHKHSSPAMDTKALRTSLYEEAVAAADAHDFKTSVDLLDRCLAICIAEDVDKLLRSNSLNERANGNFKLSQFDAALNDAKAAISCLQGNDTAEANEGRRIAFLTSGRAAYATRTFNKALEHFKAAQDIRSSEVVDTMLANIYDRLTEETTGVYDFEMMLVNLMQNPNEPLLNHADFVSNTRIGTTATMGRGLFATKDFQLGDLILCEKAFAISFEDKDNSDQVPALRSKVSQILRNSRTAKDQFYILSDGETAPAVHPGQFSFAGQVTDMVALNVFGFASISTFYGMEQEERTGVQAAEEGSAAIWIRASLFNHSCVANANRAHIGDMMVVKAMRPIKKGEELCISYIDASLEFQERQEILEGSWGFKCSCKRCQADAKLSDEQHIHRKDLINDAKAFIKSAYVKHDDDKAIKTRNVNEAKRLLRQLRLTYSDPAYRGMANVPLLDLGRFLAEFYMLTNIAKAEKTLVTLFMDLGFVRADAKGGLVFDLAGSNDLPGYGMRATLLAARLLHLKKMREHKEIFIRLCQELYETVYGAPCGFEEYADPKKTGWMTSLDVAHS